MGLTDLPAGYVPGPMGLEVVVNNPTYAMQMQCMNCGKHNNVRIPKGIIALDYDYTCETCGVGRKQFEERQRGPSLGPCTMPGLMPYR